jgi:diaminohydroxyphosphoribosylaminopyrimidine deaminase/5-amino-6-(5-phosphoribosylamino)uracil reductase
MTKPSPSDTRFMKRALELARLGAGRTLPNPRVGAVLVRGNRVIGEGYHHRAGGPHAEVNAVRDAKKRGHAVAGATLYVTLEPCSTQGRTPPCTGLILREKIARVVFAATDPNPAHAGAATQLLRKAGVEVSSGLRADEAAALNRDFNWWIMHRRPWVVAKIALSLDGRIVTPAGDDRWLTSPEARAAAHELRWESDAILIGAETARQDDPRLTIRLPGRRGKIQPWRVVVTRSGKLPRDERHAQAGERERR